MAQISVEALQKRREQLVTTHREAQSVLEQTRGAIAVVDEMLQTLANGEDKDASNVVEATDSTERQLSS